MANVGTAEKPGALAAALEARTITVVLGDRRVLGVPSLTVFPEETLAVIGPNGSGKTTLLMCLALLLKPAAGEIYYRGIAAGAGNSLALRRKLAVVFQEPLLLNGTVWRNMTLGLRLRGAGRDEARKRARVWLERFGIAGLAERNARTLSGGEAQRVNLARALALEPEVLFLDEPFAALDMPTRQSLIEDFARIVREARVTTVMVTHDRNEALALADRVAVLIDGTIRQIGPPREIFTSPLDGEVAGFVGIENVLPGMVIAQGGGVATAAVQDRHIDVISELPPGSRVTLCLHPEDITLSVAPESAIPSSARNRLTGTVARLFPLGSQVRVTVDCGFPLTALITRRSCEELGLEAGRLVAAAFKASSVHLIPGR